MEPRPERCRESWLLSDALSRECLAAREAGICEDDYPPFQKVLIQLREHFKVCQSCRIWVDDWERHGKGKQSTHAPLR